MSLISSLGYLTRHRSLSMAGPFYGLQRSKYGRAFGLGARHPRCPSVMRLIPRGALSSFGLGPHEAGLTSGSPSEQNGVQNSKGGPASPSRYSILDRSSSQDGRRRAAARRLSQLPRCSCRERLDLTSVDEPQHGCVCSQAINRPMERAARCSSLASSGHASIRPPRMEGRRAGAPAFPGGEHERICRSIRQPDCRSAITGGMRNKTQLSSRQRRAVLR